MKLVRSHTCCTADDNPTTNFHPKNRTYKTIPCNQEVALLKYRFFLLNFWLVLGISSRLRSAWCFVHNLARIHWLKLNLPLPMHHSIEVKLNQPQPTLLNNNTQQITKQNEIL